MASLKRFLKSNSHSKFFKVLAGFGRALNRFYENRNHDIYSNGEITILKKLSKLNSKIVIDGGANIGDYSLLINKIIPSCKVFCFEPVNNTFNTLLSKTKNIDNINAINKGLYKENCSMNMNVYDSHTHSSLYEMQKFSNEQLKTQESILVKGDDFLKENSIEKVDFLKIDIEGAEYDALLGFKQSILEGKIRVIQFEYGLKNISTKKLLIDYYEFFENIGYIVGKVFPKTVEFRKYNYKYEDFLGPNFIAVKKTDLEIIRLLK